MTENGVSGSTSVSDSTSASSLEEAASLGQVDILRTLIRDGVTVSANAIRAAIYGGHTSSFKLLVQSLNADARKSWIYEDLLPQACARGYVEMVEFMLFEFSSFSYGPTEQYGLQAALFHRRHPIINIFIARFPTMKGISLTPMIEADADRVPDLLPSPSQSTGPQVSDDEPGSTVRVQDYIDMNYATAFGCIFIPYEKYGRLPDGAQTMRLAARLGQPNTIELLLKAGHSVGIQDDRDSFEVKAMPIEVAAAYGHIDAVALLLDRGSEIKRALSFAVRFHQLHVVQYLLKSFPELEVDLEKGTFSEKLSEISQMSNADDRHAYHEVSELHDLINGSALALAVELKDLELAEILMDHKSKTSDPMPTLALSRASRDDRVDILLLLLRKRKFWDTEEVWISKSGLSSPREQVEIDLLHSKDRFFRLQGAQHSGEPHSLFHETMKVAVRIASSCRSNRAAKILIDSVNNPTDHNILILEASEVHPSIELLEVCSISGPAGAVLLHTGLLSQMLASKKSAKDITKTFDHDRVKRVLEKISDFCAQDSDLLDELVVEISRAAIAMNSLPLLEMALRISDPTRKPLLRSSPDLITLHLLQNHRELPSSVPHLATMASLLVEYGARLAPAMEATAVAAACMNGWAPLFFFLLQRQLPVPSIKQKFCNELLKSHGGTVDKDWTAHTCRCTKPLDLLKLTIHGIIKSDPTLITPYRDSLPLANPTSIMTWLNPLSPGYGDIITFLLKNGFSLDFKDPKVVQFCQIICFQGDMALLSEISDELRLASMQKLDDEPGTTLLDSMGLLQAACFGARQTTVSHLLRLGASAMNEARVYLPEAWTDSWAADPRLSWTPVHLATDPYTKLQMIRTSTQPPCRSLLKDIWNDLIAAGVSVSDEQRMVSDELISVGDLPRMPGSTLGLSRISKRVNLNDADRELPFVETLIRQGRTDWIRLLVERYGLDLNVGEGRPMSLITIAVKAQHISMLKLLLSYCHEHCDHEERDLLTDATLHDSRLSRILFSSEFDVHHELFQFVKREGYDINRVPHDSERNSSIEALTLLGKFCLRGFIDAPNDLERLLQHGADPNKSGSAESPLMLILSQREALLSDEITTCLERLLGAGANPNLPCVLGRADEGAYEYPIHRAARSVDPIPLLQLLINSGADYNADGGFGTPLFLAKARAYYGKGSPRRSSQEVVTFLEAQPGVRDVHGKLSFAKNGGSLKLRLGIGKYRRRFRVEEGDPFFQRWHRDMQRPSSA